MPPLPNPQFGIVSGFAGGAAAPSGLSSNVAGTTPLAVSWDGGKPTYRSGAVTQTFFSTAAAVMIEIVGSATTTVRVKRIDIWAQTATKFFTELQLLRCTGVSASGGANVPVIGRHDKNDPVPGAVINNYTAAATAGPGNTLLGTKVLATAPPTASVQTQLCGWDFCLNADKGLILRGTGDVVEVFNTILALGAGTYGYEVEWEEDLS